jgi:DNA-binding CsgD family transcriptional regulator
MASNSKKTFDIFSKKKPEYQINLNNLLRIPANVYWKDCSGIHLGCNEQTAEDTGLKSPKDYVGKNIYDISKPEMAKLIAQIDQNIIKSGWPNCTLETSGALRSKAGVYFSLKSPLYNADKSIAGLFGISFKLSDENFIKVASSLKQMQVANGLNIISEALLKYNAAKIIFDNAGITDQEAKILFLLCQGKSAKEMARIFNISSRTIETHLEHIRLKTNCKNKFQLIEKFSVLNKI